MSQVHFFCFEISDEAKYNFEDWWWHNFFVENIRFRNLHFFHLTSASRPVKWRQRWRSTSSKNCFLIYCPCPCPGYSFPQYSSNNPFRWKDILWWKSTKLRLTKCIHHQTVTKKWNCETVEYSHEIVLTRILPGCHYRRRLGRSRNLYGTVPVSLEE